MDKRRAIQILTSAAGLYKKNLEDQKILFLYGVPSEIKKQLLADEKRLSQIKGYETAFHRHNFLHLTGIIPNRSEIASSIQFYEKCVSNRLTKHDFVQDRNTKLNVPNTLLKKDIRDVTASPTQRVYAVFSKKYSDEKYFVLEKVDKRIGLGEYLFSEEIEKLIERTTI